MGNRFPKIEGVNDRYRAVPVELRMKFKTAMIPTDSGCLGWVGQIGTTGYGVININGRMLGAHRVAWALAYGEIPPKVFVCHRCDNPKCVNVEHMFLGTNADNVADMVTKGRHRPRGMVAKVTHCKHGHEFNEENTYRWHNKRQCRACIRAARARAKAKR